MPQANSVQEQHLIEHSTLFSKNLVLYRFRSKFIADQLITSQGKVDLEKLKTFLAPKKEELEGHDLHIQNILYRLAEDKTFLQKLHVFDLPLHPEFEKFVRASLGEEKEPLNKILLRKAILAALLGYLRQTVGSCFATAPCLYVLQRHPDYFLEDLFALSKKGSFQRLIKGESISVPMALSTGEHFIHTLVHPEYLEDSVYLHFKKTNGFSENLIPGKSFEMCLGKKRAMELYNMAHDPLLKIWEYTVASLCDAKGEFSESTLYLILGLDNRVPDGLGQFFYENFQKKLDDQNEKLQKAQSEAFLTHQRLAMAETLAKQATNEASLHRSRSEILAANYQLHSQSLDIDDIKKEQQKIQSLYEKNAHLLKELIPQFFQESYDPDLVSMRSFDEDAPAGFRLFIKEGLLSSKSKGIYSEEDFSRALKLFFEQLESAIIEKNTPKEHLPIVTDFITQTIQFSTSREFLEKTLERAKKRHPHALPWAYISGGTLETLLKTYFRKEILKCQKIKGDTLFVFFVELIEYFKSLPEHYLAPFRENKELGLLTETHTHACQLQPGQEFFRHFWENSTFTYSDVRDRLSLQGESYYAEKGLHAVIPDTFFKKHHKNFPSMSVQEFLNSAPSSKEHFFLASSFLISQIPKDPDRTLGYCVIGDTNWTYEKLVIGYHPLRKELALFAQDPVSLGLFPIDSMMQTPFEWKIYEDLNRIELFVPGIRI